LVTNANTYADGWNAQFSATGILPSTIATGTWFRLATTNAVAKKFTALCLAGNGYADDIVVTTINPFLTFVGTCLLLW